METKEIEETALNVASEYLKVEEDINFVVTDVEITEDDVGAAFVNGYVKEDKNKKMYVLINYLDEFKVSGYGNLGNDKKE